jgi:hypothetical protein
MPESSVTINGIRTGGHYDASQGWTDGYPTQSSKTGAVYLAAEFVITGGEYAKRKMWSNIGLYSPKGPTWTQMGRTFVRAALNSARNVLPQDNSPQAAAARRIQGFVDLDGLEFVVRVDIEKMTGVMTATSSRWQSSPTTRTTHAPWVCRRNWHPTRLRRQCRTISAPAQTKAQHRRTKRQRPNARPSPANPPGRSKERQP